MGIYDRIKQFQYLNTESTEHYRPIARLFYEQHLRFVSFLSFQDIWRLLTSSEYWGRFEINEYSEKKLEADLKALVDWEVLEVIQDNTKATSYEDYQRRKYHYKATDFLIDIERMLIENEKKARSIRGSLEKELADRLIDELARLAKNRLSSSEEVFYIWRDLMSRYEQLRNETSDYLSHINAESTERLLRSESFLPFKKQFVTYLENFVSHIMLKHTAIEKRLREIQPTHIEYAIDEVIRFEKTAPQFIFSQETYNEDEARERRRAEWEALKAWFIANGGKETGFSFLIKQTRGAINKVLRIAQQISEKAYQYKSRKADYLQAARWFYQADNVEECHKIAVYLFGAQDTKHILARPKISDSPHETVWNNDPYEISLKKNNHLRGQRQKVALVDDEFEKLMLMNEFREHQRLQREMLNRIIQGNKIRPRDINAAHPSARNAILDMIGRASVSKDFTSRTEDGRKFRMKHLTTEKVDLRSTDGTLQMPDIELEFLEDVK